MDTVAFAFAFDAPLVTVELALDIPSAYYELDSTTHRP